MTLLESLHGMHKQRPLSLKERAKVVESVMVANQVSHAAALPMLGRRCLSLAWGHLGNQHMHCSLQVDGSTSGLQLWSSQPMAGIPGPAPALLSGSKVTTAAAAAGGKSAAVAAAPFDLLAAAAAGWFPLHVSQDIARAAAAAAEARTAGTAGLVACRAVREAPSAAAAGVAGLTESAQPAAAAGTVATAPSPLLTAPEAAAPATVTLLSQFPVVVGRDIALAARAAAGGRGLIACGSVLPAVAAATRMPSISAQFPLAFGHDIACAAAAAGRAGLIGHAAVHGLNRQPLLLEGQGASPGAVAAVPSTAAGLSWSSLTTMPTIAAAPSVAVSAVLPGAAAAAVPSVAVSAVLPGAAAATVPSVAVSAVLPGAAAATVPSVAVSAVLPGAAAAGPMQMATVSGLANTAPAAVGLVEGRPVGATAVSSEAVAADGYMAFDNVGEGSAAAADTAGHKAAVEGAAAMGGAGECTEDLGAAAAGLGGSIDGTAGVASGTAAAPQLIDAAAGVRSGTAAAPQLIDTVAGVGSGTAAAPQSIDTAAGAVAAPDAGASGCEQLPAGGKAMERARKALQQRGKCRGAVPVDVIVEAIAATATSAAAGGGGGGDRGVHKKPTLAAAAAKEAGAGQAGARDGGQLKQAGGQSELGVRVLFSQRAAAVKPVARLAEKPGRRNKQSSTTLLAAAAEPKGGAEAAGKAQTRDPGSGEEAVILGAAAASGEILGGFTSDEPRSSYSVPSGAPRLSGDGFRQLIAELMQRRGATGKALCLRPWQEGQQQVAPAARTRRVVKEGGSGLRQGKLQEGNLQQQKQHALELRGETELPTEQVQKQQGVCKEREHEGQVEKQQQGAQQQPQEQEEDKQHQQRSPWQGWGREQHGRGTAVQAKGSLQEEQQRGMQEQQQQGEMQQQQQQREQGDQQEQQQQQQQDEQQGQQHNQSLHDGQRGLASCKAGKPFAGGSHKRDAASGLHGQAEPKRHRLGVAVMQRFETAAGQVSLGCQGTAATAGAVASGGMLVVGASSPAPVVGGSVSGGGGEGAAPVIDGSGATVYAEGGGGMAKDNRGGSDKRRSYGRAIVEDEVVGDAACHLVAKAAMARGSVMAHGGKGFSSGSAIGSLEHLEQHGALIQGPNGVLGLTAGHGEVDMVVGVQPGDALAGGTRRLRQSVREAAAAAAETVAELQRLADML